MRDYGDRLSFRPQVPPGVNRLAFTVCWRGGRLSVSIIPGTATYKWVDGTSVRFRHFDADVELATGEERSLPIPELAPRPAPRQPLHCEPLRRAR
jgi:alpha,alpha-trehalose phosphorylase